MKVLGPFIDDRSGLAAVEFALISPVLLLLLGGVIDFGLMMSGRSQLANGIAQGVQYALLKGASVSSATITNIVQAGSSRSGVRPAVSVNVTGPACYCISGQPAVLSAGPAALSATYACTGSCPVAGVVPQAYVVVTASYTYQPLMPFYSQLANATVTETVTVKLQ
jgi:Flp pilus assembly protein TadG